MLGFKIGYRAKKEWPVFMEAKNLTDKRCPASLDAIADSSINEDVRILHPSDGARLRRRLLEMITTL